MPNKKMYLLALTPLAATPLFLKLPAYSPTWLALNDSAHSVLFLLLTIGVAVFFHLPSRPAVKDKCWWGLWISLFSVGCAIEIAQSFIGRSASFYDVFLDAIGIAVGSLLYCGWRRRRVILVVLAGIIMCFALIKPLWVTYHSYLLKQQLPIICNFDGPCSWTLGFNHGRFETLKPHMADNKKWPNNGSEFAYLEYPVAAYPGVGMQNAFVSWQGYGELCADIYWPYLFDSQMGIHIHDANFPHKSRKFDRTLTVKGGSNTLCVSLAEVARNVDLAAAKTLIYYRPSPKEAGEFYLDNIRLR